MKTVASMASSQNGRNDVARNLSETVRIRVPLSSFSPAPLPSVSRELCQLESNFKRSAEPGRLLSYRDGSWTDLPPEVVESVRSEFSEGKPIMDVSIGGSKFVFDFLRMLQTDFETGNRRSIAWIDKNGQCFFPAAFVSEERGDANAGEGSAGNPAIQIEILVDGNPGKRKEEGRESPRKGEEEEVSSAKRQRLVPAVVPVPVPRWPNAKPLGTGDRTYSTASRHFLDGIRKIDPNATISSISKYTPLGALEAARVEVFQKQNETVKAARGASTMVYAWYGGSAKEVAGILARGFSVPSKLSPPGTYGVGVNLYHLSLPHLSALQSETDEHGLKHVLLCRVLLGNVEKVEEGSKQCHPSSDDFDTAADDPKNPKRYVVWFTHMNRSILPECVVSFKSSVPVTGELRESAQAQFAKLFSKMKSSLPASKVQELMSMYDNFRAGKVAKDVFIKQLRTVGGEKVLASTIREILDKE